MFHNDEVRARKIKQKIISLTGCDLPNDSNVLKAFIDGVCCGVDAAYDTDKMTKVAELMKFLEDLKCESTAEW